MPAMTNSIAPTALSKSPAGGMRGARSSICIRQSQPPSPPNFWSGSAPSTASRRRCAASRPIFDATHAGRNQNRCLKTSKPIWKRSAPTFGKERAGHRASLRAQTLASAHPLSRRRASGDRQPCRRACDPRHRYRKTELAFRRIKGGRRARRRHLFHHSNLQAQQRRTLSLYHRRHAQNRCRLAQQPRR